MPYELPLPSRLTPWKVKIFDNERVETPHVTIVSKRTLWRVDLRMLEFMDREPPPRDLPDEVMLKVQAAHSLLMREWDARHPLTLSRVVPTSSDTMRTLDVIVGRQLARELAGKPRGRFRVVRSRNEVRRALESRGLKTWITSSLDDVSVGLKSLVSRGLQHSASESDFWYLPTLSNESGPAARAMDELWLIQRFFEPQFVMVPPSAVRLPLGDFVDAVLEAEPRRSDLVVAGVVQGDSLTVWRADGRTLDVPLQVFQPAGDGTAPDFTQFGIGDCGLTLRFGSYESTVDVVLYQLDPDYRRRARQNARQQDRSFGASLRRLRLLRGLRQTDFSPEISEREIRRIEANEVEHIHQDTQDALARRLKVEFSDIASY